MNTPTTQRRLAAILAADVVGYSKLMAADEAGTLAALQAHRKELFDPETTKRGGRIVKLMGDGTLAEFPSVVDAVECALAIQKALAKEDGPIKLRIGINLGDVIIDGDDIYGDGVNVAARMEEIAPPGGICISSIVHESLGNRIEAEFTNAGEHQVKNITRPIRVFQWVADGPAAPAIHQRIPAELKQDQTISVTHFENLSNDDELGYFCEGVTQDIIAALGKIAQVTVVSDDYQPAGGTETSASRETARYILAGKVRKSGKRIRISAQLIDSVTGVQRWADRYDRDAADLFDVQDNVTRNIIIAVHSELGTGAYTNRWQWGTENFEAWQKMATGFREFQKFSPDSMLRAAAIWTEALALDPDYLSPRAARAYCHAHLALIHDGEAAQGYIDKAQAAFDKCTADAPDDTRPYSAKRGIEIARGNFDTAIAASQTALDMEPGTSANRANLAYALLSGDRPADALAQLTIVARDIRNSAGWFDMIHIHAHYMLGNLTEAMSKARQTVTRLPEFNSGPPLAAALAAESEQPDEAAVMCNRTLQMDPQFSARMFVRWQGLKSQKYRDRLFKALVAAGLPE